MKRTLAAIVLAAAFIADPWPYPLGAPPATADEPAVAANALLLLQAGDDLTSRSVMLHGGYERDPLARGIVRSNAGVIISTLALNLAARLLFRHAPHVTEAFAGVEAAAIVNNARVIRRLK